jgi:signal transduction histidine kinase
MPQSQVSLRFQTIKNISDQIYSDQGIRKFLFVAAFEARKAIKCDRVSILHFPKPLENYAVVVAESTGVDQFTILGKIFKDEYIVNPPEKLSVTANIATHGTNACKELLSSLELRACIAATIYVDGARWGILLCQNITPFAWKDIDALLALDICEYIGVATKQIDAFEIIKDKERYLGAMSEIAEITSMLTWGDESTITFKSLIKVSLQIIADVLRANKCSVFKDFKCVAWWGMESSITDYNPLKSILYPLSQNILIQDRVMNLETDLKDFLSCQKVKSVVFIPIMVASKYWGFIQIDNYQLTWTELETSIFRKIASMIGNAIAQKEINDVLNSSLEEVIDKAPIVLYRLNATGEFTFCKGKGLEDITMFHGEQIGKNIFEEYPDCPAITRFFKKALVTPKHSGIIEFHGTTFHNHTVLLSSGELVGVAIDFTEQFTAQKDLEHIIYAISHDLKEPIRAIANNQKLIEKRLVAINIEDGEIKSRLARGFGSIKRMSTLIDEQLELSRINSTKKPFENQDSSQIIAESLELLSERISKSGTAIKFISPFPTVQCDKLQIVQLFQNLISNAIKFYVPTDNELPTIWIGCQMRGTRFWQFSVADNGIGIEEAYYKQIFDIWKRLHDESEFPGTGMGLALCAKIVKRHKGTIWVESEGQGQGSTFYFTLPVGDPNLLFSDISALDYGN